MTVFDAYQGGGVMSLFEFGFVVVPVALFIWIGSGGGRGVVRWVDGRWPWLVQLIRELFGGEGLKK